MMEKNVYFCQSKNVKFRYWKMRILVAEDNLMNRRLMELWLSEWGYAFDMVENGRLAVEQFGRDNYELVLMDIQMPEMDGLTASRHIRQDYRSEVPIIAITAKGQSNCDNCAAYGITEILNKPIQEDLLRQKIARYTEGVPPHAQIAEDASFSARSVINLDYLHGISKGRKEFVLEMARLFILQFPKELLAAETALNNKDFVGLGKAAHSMKSTVGFVGMHAGGLQLISELERKSSEIFAPSASTQTLSMLFTQVKKIGYKAISEMKTYLAGNAA
jgi:CheY-like chemotaxis protein/HPt (histidine-containing phosphotransfer) domain-containing protein